MNWKEIAEKYGKKGYEVIAPSHGNKKKKPTEKRLYNDILKFTSGKRQIGTINSIKRGYRNDEFEELLNFFGKKVYKGIEYSYDTNGHIALLRIGSARIFMSGVPYETDIKDFIDNLDVQ